MAEDWLRRDLSTTYYFLAITLDEREDFDEPWPAAMQRLLDQIPPSWLCGDAGLWHRSRLLPTVMCASRILLAHSLPYITY